MKRKKDPAGAWNRQEQLPEPLRHLPPPVRSKAVEFAGVLLREHVDEAVAIRIAAAKARAWALHERRRAETEGWR